MTRRLGLIATLAVLALTSVPAVSPATFIPGPNGKIVFTSGRPSEGVPAPNMGDAGARLYVVDYPSGTPVQVTTLPEGVAVRHRQPSWSPDHTRIVYAAGASAGDSYALWILDLRTGSQTEFVPAAKEQDRPSWSPDGTEIAYGANGDLWVKEVAPGSEAVQLTKTAGVAEERPVWSPDGNTLYYNRGVEPDRDIYKISPVAPSGTVTPILEGATDDWQPALSPDGKTLCFLRGPKGEGANLSLVGVNGGLTTPFATSSLGELNCVWSPDGSKILYTQGAFGKGEMVTRDIDGENLDPFGFNVAEHFDGNADWATNFSPECDARVANIGVNQFTKVQLTCTDPDAGFGKEPPTPEPIEDSGLEIVSPPSHGAIGGISDDETVVYTPNKDFKGTDTFTYTGSDGTSEAQPAVVTIQVGQEGGGGDKKPPKISAVKVSVKRWRLGKKLASISRAPVGTTISFKISERAKATLTFKRKTPGKNGGKPKYKAAGKLSLNAKAGKRKVRFQGRVSRSKTLKPGTYRVVVGAKDAAGNRAKAVTGPTFTIVSH
jgi:Tol biopolymer transport system component